MEENRFFKFVWRFNGLVIMVAGLLAILLILGVGFMALKEFSREDMTRNIMNVQKEVNLKEILKLQNLQMIKGSFCVAVSLTSLSKKKLKSFSSSYEPSSIKNILFINNKNHTQYWLFENNDYLIYSTDFLTKDNNKDNNVDVIVYRVIKDDSNQDNVLSREDLQTIAISLPDGTKYTELIEGVDNFIGQKFIEKDILLMMYQKKGRGFFSKIDIKTFTLLEEVELAKIGL